MNSNDRGVCELDKLPVAPNFEDSTAVRMNALRIVAAYFLVVVAPSCVAAMVLDTAFSERHEIEPLTQPSISHHTYKIKVKEIKHKKRDKEKNTDQIAG